MRAKVFEGQLWVLAEDAAKAITEASTSKLIMGSEVRKPTSPNQALFDAGVFNQKPGPDNDLLRKQQEAWREFDRKQAVQKWAGPNYSGG